MPENPDGLTQLLNGHLQGSDGRAEQLYQLVHAELRRLAAQHLRAERADHTLQPTALVNEAWLRLGQGTEKTWQSRAHFLAFAAQVMRHILVDYGRRRRAPKRSNDPGTWPEFASYPGITSKGINASFFDIDRALRRLEALDSRQAQVVELRFFGGMTDEEAAEVLGISSRTVKRDWQLAKVWLHGELKGLQSAAAAAGAAR
jgi:RNA polymerase sigma-70 factor (ECF subfamily)